KQSDKRPNFQRTGFTVRQAEHIVKEFVVVIPHFKTSVSRHGRSNPEKVLGKLYRHLFIHLVMLGKFNCDLQHYLAVKGHPRRCICLLQIPACWQRRTAVKHSNVIKAEKTSLKNIVSVSILAIYPPGEI